MTVQTDVQTLEPGNLIDLFALDCTALGGAVLRFHEHLTAGVIRWQGFDYAPWPLEADGFARSGTTQASPTLTLANIDGSLTALCMAYEDLVGSVLTRHRTLSKYLDAYNFPGGVNPTADPTQEMPQEIWYVERKVAEDNTTIQFEMSSAMDLNGMQLPRRQIIANTCLWLTIGGYRGPYCGYVGGPVAKADDTDTSDMAQDRCGGRVASCKKRFGETGQLNHGGFPGAGLIR